MSKSFVFAGFIVCLSIPAFADNIVSVQLIDSGAAERIEAAATLRVLSQEVASAACHMVHDINPAEARGLMLDSKIEFDTILDALQFGSEEMHFVGEEEHRRTIVKIEELRKDWRPIFEAAGTLLGDPHNEGALTLIKANNEAILEQTTLLLGDIEETYANPTEMSQRDVMLVGFSARQAMLTQKMAKISCEIGVGNRSEDRLSELSETIQIFELTLRALLNGMPEVGIIAAPTAEIESALQNAVAAWDTTKAELELVLSDEETTLELRENLFHDLNVALKDMTNLEHLYVAYSKHSLES